MRPLFTILFLLISFASYAQDARLFQNEWYLTKLTINGSDYLNPKNENCSPVSLIFQEVNSEVTISTFVCDAISGTAIFDSVNPTFTNINVVQTLGGCSLFGDSSNIERDYFAFYSDGSILTYEITGSLDNLSLVITSENGNQAIYSSLLQIERIDEGRWTLKNLIINSENNLDPLNSQGTPVTTEFNSDSSFGSWICESTGGKLNYGTDSFTFSVSDGYSTLGGCIPPSGGVDILDVYDIEQKLNNFLSLFSPNAKIFCYEIEPSNLDIPKTLTITDIDGDQAIYYKATLSAKHFSSVSFSIYPNPVVDELLISSSENLNKYKVEVFDLLGKLKISKKKTSSNSINVQSLSKGVYLLLITDELGNSVTKKFIK